MRRLFAAVACVLMSVAMSGAEDAPKPLTIEEAAKKIDQKVTVELEVKSASVRNGNGYLNSHIDFKDPKNFTVFVTKDGVESFKKAKIEDIADHFKGKKILVTGTVMNFKEKPQIKVTEADQIKLTVVEKK
ncbi:hypothetical protein [Zavarzinella formosa]|uniref:hypothetical protein n=1 Tax=Zavarzinella formosa TaxID=360055 RepID=UPI0002E5B902|nr:hypothetical protein [Zavarzinella formosa]